MRRISLDDVEGLVAGEIDGMLAARTVDAPARVHVEVDRAGENAWTRAIRTSGYRVKLTYADD